MQLKKASKKTSKAAEKTVSLGEKIASPETPKAKSAKSSKAKKSEGAEMTSGKNLHKPATPATITASTQSENAPKTTPRAEAKPILRALEKATAHEDIAKLAYSYWLERGGAHGFAEADWLRAETELSVR